MARFRRCVPLFAALMTAAALGTLQPAHAGQVSYQYDALGRVVRVVYPNGVIVEYTYDASGNRVTVVKS